ncbi:hypothetical protein FKM82_018768 [Ascaphus truei]
MHLAPNCGYCSQCGLVCGCTKSPECVRYSQSRFLTSSCPGRRDILVAAAQIHRTVKRRNADTVMPNSWISTVGAESAHMC